MPPTMGSLTADANNTSSLRRSSSIRRAQSMAGAKRRSLPLQVKHTADSLLEVVRRTRLHFVHCLVPSEKPPLAGEAGDGGEPCFDVDLVRSQLKGAQILDAVRVRKQGFPENLLYLEFRRRYGLLASPDSRVVNGEESSDERAATEALLRQLDLEPSSYRLGLSQVQELAICCIQRNVRKFLEIRDWPWWRLFVKIAPVLNVQRTEQELRLSRIRYLDDVHDDVHMMSCGHPRDTSFVAGWTSTECPGEIHRDEQRISCHMLGTRFQLVQDVL
ncbi:hypothetical protein V5799_030514 [Amblyomma americanum]|uniref:Myosin motor domain-containing protein n=1 Tax=Amblyomma americanum TaxID=6943 RepID=A0AAQ4ENB7_AMBAM